MLKIGQKKICAKFGLKNSPRTKNAKMTGLYDIPNELSLQSRKIKKSGSHQGNCFQDAHSELWGGGGVSTPLWSIGLTSMLQVERKVFFE